jgi:hypothetical protein
MLYRIAFAASFAVVAWGQIGGGSLVGYVNDPAGSAVTGAKVKVIQIATNVAQEATTNETGYYEFPLLGAGRYRLEAMAPGFEKSVSAEFDLYAGTRPRIDLQLKVGSITESVVVTAAPAAINTTSTELGVVMDRARVEELPLNGRDFQELLGLQAGVENAPSSAAGDRGGVSFHGSSALSTNMLLDGVDMSFGEVNGSAGFKSAGGGSVLINTVSIEALSEFKTTGSAFTAEYGRTGGGVVTITTRSGTNRFHGTAFEYFRNDKLDANDFFSNQNGLGKPPLRWNQFGGNLGGPVKRDRVFFFFNYEGAQVKRVSKVTGNTATPALLAAVPDAIRSTLDFYLPKTFTPTSNVYVGAHVRNDRQVNDENTFLTRGDVTLNAHRLGLRHSYNHQNYSSPTLSPVMPTLYPMRFQNAMVQDTWTVNGRNLNELRLGLNRVDLDRHAVGTDQIPAWITVSAINASQNSYIHFLTTTYTIADNFSMIRGSHTLKAGVELREVRSARIQGGPPTYAYNSYADLIAEKPTSVTLLFGGGKGLHTRNMGYYFQDEWRVSRHVQANIGLRYEYSPPLKGGFNIASSDPFGPFIQAKQPMFAADRNDWAPRAGIVWTPGRDQRTAIRAGGALSYLMPQAIHFYDMAYINPALPFNTSFSAADVPAAFLIYPFTSSFTNQVEADPSLLPKSFRLSRSVADYNRRDTYVGMWNLSIQHRVTPKVSVQGSYVGQRTVKLISMRPLNLVDPVTKVRPDQSLGQINVEENAANIAYHGLELSVNQKSWHGLRTDAYMTWAKSNSYYNADDTITFTGSALQDPMNIAGSKGPVRGLPLLRYTSVISYAIPSPKRWRPVLGGWTFRTINTWRGGIPINVTSGVDVVGNGRSAGQRPDPVQGVDPYVREGLVWLNPAAFTTAGVRAEKRFGYLGYNAFRGPGALTLNAALHKNFKLTETQQVTFRLETFNTLNHPVLSAPVTNFNDPNFGKIQTASGGRNVQLALKYAF